VSCDIVDIGASRLDPETNELKVQAKSAPIGDDDDDAPDFGDTPLVCALGVVARPYPRTAEGSAQGVIDTSLPGTNGWIVAARDYRSVHVVEELAAGETALHSTGKDFDARVFCKNQLVAIMVGDDVAVVIDRKNESISITGFGRHSEISRENGVAMTDGEGASIQLKGGVICLTGQIVLGGRQPVLPVATVAPGPPALAAAGAGVFLGI
jgi:hypothetical protein